MKIEELLAKLARKGILDLTDLTTDEAQQLRLLVRFSSMRGKAFQKLRLTPNYLDGYSVRRFARRVRSHTGFSKVEKVRKRPLQPKAGRFVKLNPEKRTLTTASRLRAMAVIQSHKKSGTLSAQLIDPRRLQTIEIEAQVESQKPFVLFWQVPSMSVQNYLVLKDLDRNFIEQNVLLGAYTGDLRQLQFEQIHSVDASTDCFYPYADGKIPLKQGANLVATVKIPAGLQTIVPAALAIYGPYSNSREGVSTELRTLPQFKAKLGYIELNDGYLCIATKFDDDTWDCFASINGWIQLFDKPIAISSDLPQDTGILSFNLETRTCPKQSDLRALAPLVNGRSLFVDAWKAFPLLTLITHYQLTRLNLVIDLGNPAVVSVAFGIRCNEMTINYDKLGIVAVLKRVTFDWLIGMPAGDHIVSTSGSCLVTLKKTGKGVKFEGAITSHPIACVDCWADSDTMSASAFESFVGRKLPQGFIYGGCVVKLFHGSIEVYAMNESAEIFRVE